MKCSLDRRTLLKCFAAGGALTVLDARAHFAFAATPGDRRLVVVILRGALDGMAAVPPYGDKDYAARAREFHASNHRHRRAA